MHNLTCRLTIENLNGLIKQYIPKGTDFTNVSHDEIKIIEKKIK
jgi:IS30 family transposase